jgi:hypothetical protein
LAKSAVQAIKNEIERKQGEIEALKTALAALGGTTAVRAKGGKGTRRPRTAAEKAAMSKAMKAAWRRRKAQKAGAMKSAGKTAGKKAGARKTGQAAPTAAG